MSHINQAIHLLQAAVQERNRMTAVLMVLLQKSGGEAVITHAEVEAVMNSKYAIRQTEETDLGFKVALKEISPAPEKPV